MRGTRRKLRNFVADIAGVPDVQICWTPQIPIMYINNPKAGCSTIKHSLKLAQAEEYIRTERKFERIEDPHVRDDCLRTRGLRVSEAGQRFLIACVRNPYTRALSGYLDKLQGWGQNYHRKHRLYRATSFEDFLVDVAKRQPKTVDDHFRPQHINLCFPDITYDAIFYLEDLSPLSWFLSQLSPNFCLETYAPHARSAASKLRNHYSNRVIQLVQGIYDEDFSYFSYSRSLDDAVIAPGAFIAGRRVVSNGEEISYMLSRPQNDQPCKAIMSALFFRKLIDMRLI